MIRRFIEWIKLLIWGEPPAPHIKPPPPNIINCANERARKPLTDLVAALLGGKPPALVAELPWLIGRSWWDDPRRPELTHVNWPEIADCRNRLDELAAGCERITWAEVSVFPELFDAFSEAVARFQYEETILCENDLCPLPWSSLAYKAAVAAYHTVWLTQTLSEGMFAGRFDAKRQVLRRWFGAAADLAPARSGDLIILHLLHRGLSEWSKRLQKRFEEERERESQARSELQSVKRGNQASYGARVRGLIAVAEEKLRQAERRSSDARAALGELEGWLGCWRALNPITHLTTPATRPQSGGEITPLAFGETIAIRRTEGLQHWVIREMARQGPLSNDQASATVNSGVFDTLRVAAEKIPAGRPLSPRSADDWAAPLFLLRFYRLWAQCCPPVEQVKAKIPKVEPSDHEQFKQFFAPWERIRKLAIEFQGAPGIENPIFQSFWREYHQLTRPDQPQPGPKSYVLSADSLPPYRDEGGEPQTTEEKILALRKHLMSVVGVETTEIINPGGENGGS